MKKFIHICKYLVVLSLISIFRIVVPNKGKKMMYIVSIYSQLVQDKILEATTLDKLNMKLNLACQPEALQLPMELGEVIWKDISFKDLFKEELGQYYHYDGTHCIPFTEAQIISAKIVERTPKWLRYDNKSNMVRDVATLFWAASARPI